MNFYGSNIICVIYFISSKLAIVIYFIQGSLIELVQVMKICRIWTDMNWRELTWTDMNWYVAIILYNQLLQLVFSQCPGRLLPTCGDGTILQEYVVFDPRQVLPLDLIEFINTPSIASSLNWLWLCPRSSSDGKLQSPELDATPLWGGVVMDSVTRLWISQSVISMSIEVRYQESMWWEIFCRQCEQLKYQQFVCLLLWKGKSYILAFSWAKVVEWS